LETGTSLGINTLYLAKGINAEVLSIEKNQHLKKYHQDTFKSKKNVEVIYGDLSEIFPEIVVKKHPELIFLDADHRSVSILNQLETIKANVHSVKAVVIHDIYWSRDMKDCWEQIVKSTHWNCTVDLFHAGIIFPKLQIPKQHFIIKF
jgi:predicted O-methyltransferase YrrM